MYGAVKYRTSKYRPNKYATIVIFNDASTVLINCHKDLVFMHSRDKNRGMKIHAQQRCDYW